MIKRLLGILMILLASNHLLDAQQATSPQHVVMVASRDLYLCDVYKQAPAQILDTARLTLCYDVKYRRDTAAKMGYSRDKWVLQIGDKITKNYSQALFFADSLVGDRDDYALQSTEERPMDEIIKEHKSGVLKEYQRLPLFQRASVFYKEPHRVPKWGIEAETCEILGYPCRKATASFYGRQWSVWFTMAIPLSEGPWKLSGLPGIIMAASDATQSYQIQCLSISRQPSPIVHYDRNSREIAKRKWRKLIRLNHLSPFSSVAQGGLIGYYTFGKKEPFGSDWTIPYNPIERE